MFKFIAKVVVFASFLWVFPAQAEEAVNIYAIPRAVPEHKVIHQSGKSYRLSDFKGEFVVAVFWSRDCPPCIKELKSLNGFYKAIKGNGVRLVLISPSEEWISVEQQKRFLKKYGAPDVEFYVDEKGNLASDFGIFTSPHTVLVNKKGEEIGRIKGSADWEDDKVIEYIYKLKSKHG